MSLVCILWDVYLGMYALVCILFVTLLVKLFVTQLVDLFVTQLVELFVTPSVCNPSGKKKLLVRVKCRLRHMCFRRNLLFYQGELAKYDVKQYTRVEINLY